MTTPLASFRLTPAVRVRSFWLLSDGARFANSNSRKLVFRHWIRHLFGGFTPGHRLGDDQFPSFGPYFRQLDTEPPRAQSGSKSAYGHSPGCAKPVRERTTE